MQTQELIRKISKLPSQQLFEVEHLVKRFARQKNGERNAKAAAIKAYAESFAGTEFDLIEQVTD